MIFFRLVCLGISLGSIHSAIAGPVAKERRDLIAIVNLSELATKHHWLYRQEETQAIRKIHKYLGKSYRKIHLFSGTEATRANLLETIEKLENDSAVTTIDAVIYVHGHPGELGFVDTGFYSTDRLRDDILKISSGKSPSPKKLRALYSDACYGQSHIADWLKAGFQVASGAIGVDANRSMDLKKFMKSWRSGKSFADAIRAANSVGISDLMDRAIGGNSEKMTEGAVASVIY